MNETNNKNLIDDDWEQDLSIWVVTDKSRNAFLESLAEIISPIEISNGKFNLGAIECEVKNSKKQPNNYEGIPTHLYAFEVNVTTTPYLIWGVFDKKFIYALTLGLRTKFNCQYLITTDSDEFVMYSGTNEPYYVNLNYRACTNGELLPSTGCELIELRI